MGKVKVSINQEGIMTVEALTVKATIWKQIETINSEWLSQLGNNAVADLSVVGYTYGSEGEGVYHYLVEVQGCYYRMNYVEFANWFINYKLSHVETVQKRSMYLGEYISHRIRLLHEEWQQIFLK